MAETITPAVPMQYASDTRPRSTGCYIQRLCKEGKVPGAQQFGPAWMVPTSYKLKPQKPGPKPKGKR